MELLGLTVCVGQRTMSGSLRLHVSARLAFEQLALVETLGIGAHAVDRGAPTAADAVLIIGAGPIGLATFEFARLTGATTIFMDLNEERLRFAREVMGCDHTLVAQGDIEAQLRELTDGDLPNVVFDATGSNVSMSQAVNYIAPTGSLVFVGLTAREVSFPHMAVHRPEISLHATRNSLPENFRRIIALIEEGRIDTAPWITHRSAFGDLIGDFPAYTRLDSGVIKAIVTLD